MTTNDPAGVEWDEEGYRTRHNMTTTIQRLQEKPAVTEAMHALVDFHNSEGKEATRRKLRELLNKQRGDRAIAFAGLLTECVAFTHNSVMMVDKMEENQ